MTHATSAPVHPRTLSPAEFLQTVDDLNPRIAVFDCDGTLWSPDAGSGFMTYSIESGLLSRDAADWLDDRHRRYRRGEVDEISICGEMVQVYQGLHEHELRAAAAAFFARHIAPRIFPVMEEVINRLNARGTQLWAVSSTNDWVIEEGVRRFGIPPERVLAARVEIAEGLVSDRIRHVPSGPQKVVALQRAGVLTPDAVFGNSVHDADMLAIARHPFAVNPTPALVERSATDGWPVFFPQTAD